MRALLVGRREIQDQPMDYYLLAEECENLCENYGVEISCASGEDVAVPGITPSQNKITGLLALLLQHTVTPSALRDIVDDWLLQ